MKNAKENNSNVEWLSHRQKLNDKKLSGAYVEQFVSKIQALVEQVGLNAGFQILFFFSNNLEMGLKDTTVSNYIIKNMNFD